MFIPQATYSWKENEEDKENKIKPTSTTKGSKTLNRQQSKCTNWKKKEPCEE